MNTVVQTRINPAVAGNRHASGSANPTKMPSAKVIPFQPPAAPSGSTGQPASKKGTLPEARLIRQYIQEKNEDALVRTFYAGIVKYAGQKQFMVAEKLREKLMELVPMALTEIIETGEIIDREKNAAMDPEKMKPFADLFNQFSQAEATAFFTALTHKEVPANIPVFEQCHFDDHLYFIQSGRFILSYFDVETRQNIDFAILQKGDIAGADAFFTLTGHTTTLTPIEKSSISVLHKTAYQKLLAESPNIEQRLVRLCNSRKKCCRIDASRRQARRRHRRYSIDLKGKFKIIDEHGRMARDVTRMNVVDLSAGGMCFIVHNMKPEIAQTLHRKWVMITASYPSGNALKNFTAVGKVVSIRHLPFDDSSIHIRFKEPFSAKSVMEIVEKMRPKL